MNNSKTLRPAFQLLSAGLLGSVLALTASVAQAAPSDYDVSAHCCKGAEFGAACPTEDGPGVSPIEFAKSCDQANDDFLGRVEEAVGFELAELADDVDLDDVMVVVEVDEDGGLGVVAVSKNHDEFLVQVGDVVVDVRVPTNVPAGVKDQDGTVRVLVRVRR